MAQKIQVLLVDDLDGGEAEETVSFGLDGVEFEIDLTAENAANLREALADYIGSARRVGRRRNSGRKRTGTGGTDTAAIRDWARTNGVQVSERGRVAAEVVAQYEAAHA